MKFRKTGFVGGSGTKVSLGAGQVVPNNTVVDISFDTVDFDDLGWWHLADPTHIVIDRNCRILVGMEIAWVYPTASGFRINTGVEMNNGGVPNNGIPICSSFIPSATSGAVNAGFASSLIEANAGDTFSLYALQVSGGNMTTWYPGAEGSDTQVSPALYVQILK